MTSIKRNVNERIVFDPIGMEGWKDYYKDLLTEKRTEWKNVTYDRVVEQQVEKVTVDEVKTALKGMKNNRSPGPGGIPIELVKYAPEILLENLANLFTKCMENVKTPMDWKVGYRNSVYKKGSKQDCNNYRGISVLASVGRLYGRIMKKRIENEMEEEEEQSSFRSGRSCIDNIFSLKLLMEKKLAHGREMHMLFVDLKKAYDSIPLNKLWEAMEKGNISGNLINIVKEMYAGYTCCIKIGKEISEEFNVNKGLRQGCCISPTLFKIYIGKALNIWSKKCRSMGVQIGEDNVHTLLFADDQIVLAEDRDDIEYMTRKLLEEYRRWGLEINLGKTEYMVAGGEGSNLVIDDDVIKHTKEYKYLGVLITSDNRDDKDIREKTNKGRIITRQLSSILWNKDIKGKTKKRIFETMVESCTTYGAETWVLNKRMLQRVSATEMNY